MIFENGISAFKRILALLKLKHRFLNWVLGNDWGFLELKKKHFYFIIEALSNQRWC